MSLGSIIGDIGQVLTGHNPFNKPPPSNIPATGLPGSSIPIAPSSGQTVMSDSTDPTSTDGGDDGGTDWGSILSSITGGVGAVSGDVLQFLKDHGSQLLQAASVGDAAYRQVQSDKYATGAINDEKQLFADKAPLRSEALAGLENPQASMPNLTNLQNLSGANSGNAFAKSIPLAPLEQPQATGAPATPAGPTIVPSTAPPIPIGGAGYVPPASGYKPGQPLPANPTNPALPPGAAVGVPALNAANKPIPLATS